MKGVTSKVEWLSSDQIVQGVVIEGRYIFWLPNLVFQAFPELVLKYVIMSPLQEG